MGECSAPRAEGPSYAVGTKAVVTGWRMASKINFLYYLGRISLQKDPGCQILYSKDPRLKMFFCSLFSFVCFF